MYLQRNQLDHNASKLIGVTDLFRHLIGNFFRFMQSKETHGYYMLQQNALSKLCAIMLVEK